MRIRVLAPLLGTLLACTGKIGDPSSLGAPGDGNNPPPTNPPPTNPPPVDPPPGAPYLASETLARRLSQAEMDATLRDLLGDTTQPARRFLSEDSFTPYDNDYTVQLASQTFTDSMAALADDVATRALADAAGRRRVVPCTPTGAGDAACFRTFVEQFGRRALRRPLAQPEIDAYLALQSFSVEQSPYYTTDFYTGVALVIRAILQDPEFQHRVEAGSATTLPGVLAIDEYAIASRLSYLLWGTTPDDALLADAEAGVLSTAAGRRVAAERMLADPRAQDQVHRFHALWLGYRAIPHAANLVDAFQRETNALLDRVIFERKSSYLEVFLSDQTYLDDFLADHYGLPRPSGGQGWVPYGASGRAGLLSHGAVLASFSKFTDTSPTQRGILVRNRLMCQVIQRPPPNVNADQPPPAVDSPCKKSRYEAHRTTASCASCHAQMDPIGFGLEAYDIAGRFRTHDDGHPECLVDGEGELPGFGQFNGPAQLAQKLTDADLLQRCVVQQYLSYALGRALNTGEVKAVDELHQDFEARGLGFDQLILSLVESEAFALKKEGN